MVPDVVVLSVVCLRPTSNGVTGATSSRTLLLTEVVNVLAVASTSYTPKGTALPRSSTPSHTRACSPPPRLRRYSSVDTSSSCSFHTSTVTLAERDNCPQDAEAIRRGENYIRQHAQFLRFEPYETVGFELILPTLLEKALRLNLNLPYAQFSKYSRIREKKLQMILET